MGNRRRIVKIGNKEFAVDRDTVMRIYGGKGNNIRVIYNGEMFKIDSKHSLQNAEKEESVRLTFESFETKVAIPKISEYSVYTGRQGLINSGEKLVLASYMEDTSFTILDSERSSENAIEIQISVESPSLNSKQDVDKHTLERMYEKDTSIKMLESEDTIYDDSESTHFSDLHTLSDFDNASYLNRIGVGAFRKVYEITDKSKISHITESDNAVIKIAKDTRGVESNKREFQTWCAVKGTHLEKYFCKILNRGPEFRYIIMKKADKVISDAEYEERVAAKDELTSNIENAIREETIETPGEHGFDISYGNIGKMNGDDFYKFIDYPFGGNFQVVD